MYLLFIGLHREDSAKLKRFSKRNQLFDIIPTKKTIEIKEKRQKYYC